jgi:uncharacterized FlgJ-related protein
MKKILILIVLSIFNFSFVSQKTKLTPLELYNEILEQELEYPDVVFAQAILESGAFSSKVYKNNNNLFGMRMPNKRITLAVGQKYGYAVYEYWQESVADYALYQEHYFKNRKISKSQYLAHINKSYSESADYVKKLNRILKEYSNILYEPPKDRYDGLINYYDCNDCQNLLDQIISPSF